MIDLVALAIAAQAAPAATVKVDPPQAVVQRQTEMQRDAASDGFEEVFRRGPGGLIDEIELDGVEWPDLPDPEGDQGQDAQRRFVQNHSVECTLVFATSNAAAAACHELRCLAIGG